VGDKELVEFQEANCRGCYFADEKVGTGHPCCTYPSHLHIEGKQIGTQPPECLTRREVNRV